MAALPNLRRRRPHRPRPLAHRFDPPAHCQLPDNPPLDRPRRDSGDGQDAQVERRRGGGQCARDARNASAARSPSRHSVKAIQGTASLGVFAVGAEPAEPLPRGLEFVGHARGRTVDDVAREPACRAPSSSARGADHVSSSAVRWQRLYFLPLLRLTTASCCPSLHLGGARPLPSRDHRVAAARTR